MSRNTVPDTQNHQPLLRRVMSTSPWVLGVYGAATLALGYGFGNPAFDAAALAATAGGYALGTAGVKKVTNHLDGLV